MVFIGSTRGTLIPGNGVTVRAMALGFRLAPMLAVTLVSLSMGSSTVLAVIILGQFLAFYLFNVFYSIKLIVSLISCI